MGGCEIRQLVKLTKMVWHEKIAKMLLQLAKKVIVENEELFLLSVSFPAMK